MPNTNTLLGARDRAILEMLYCTGLRISELVALNMDDIDFLSDAVHVKAPGRKERVVPIWSSGIQALQKYVSLRNKRAQTDPAFANRILFVNKNGERLSSRSVRRKMDKYLIKAGLDPSISPRTLRHSFAVNMLRSGSDIHGPRTAGPPVALNDAPTDRSPAKSRKKNRPRSSRNTHRKLRRPKNPRNPLKTEIFAAQAGERHGRHTRERTTHGCGDWSMITPSLCVRLNITSRRAVWSEAQDFMKASLPRLSGLSRTSDLGAVAQSAPRTPKQLPKRLPPRWRLRQGILRPGHCEPLPQPRPGRL